ncbi:MAG TPA: UDP-glucose 4-epimerase GalE [Bacteroidia bacterium]
MKNILVTGGLGYIGSHTVVELVKNGFKPIIIDNLSNSEILVLDRIKSICGTDIPFVQGDVCDVQVLNDVIQKHKIDGVIHFAAFKAVGESVEKPLKYYRNNIGGLVSLLEAMNTNGIKNLVFSSSCTVYGEPDQSPVDENAAIKTANSPYGNTKQIGEEIINECKQLNAVILRYFNPIGAHPSAKIGELPLGVPNNLVPFITQTAAGLREKLTVFGSDYNTKDGTCVRDYIHVVDLAKAHVIALDYISNHPENKVETFNIGTGNGHTVLEVIKTFESVNNIKLNYTIGPRRSGDVEKVWANPEKAEKQLGWKAELGLEEMLRSSWAWQSQL